MLTVDMEEEKISDIEWKLAERLRQCCTPIGDEKESSMRQSSDILFEMGKLYLNKSLNTKGLAQKINFIKCATLLHGARVRYEKLLNDQDMGGSVRHALKGMGEALVHACGGQDYDIGFLDASWKLEHYLNQLRETEKRELENLENIPDGIPESHIWEKRKERIKAIKEILEKNTSQYKAIMIGITIECYMILGKPSCKYAIVGLGSLARDEVTLYSDFEHVIIIDDNVEKLPRDEQEKVQEYFRWFTIIFQIIIIGMGETFIRSVGIKSLNDLYSEDESKNWYYDMFTPSGISFDGRVPHSCNTPLGRLENTKNRRSKIELIQPASKMAKLLTSDEHIKYGYYLSDLLARTCLVIGDQDLYANFREKTFEILGEGNCDKSIEEWEKLLVPKSGTVLNFSLTGALKTYCNVKSMFYRPVTAILAYWAKKWRLTAGSSFDCVSHIRTHPKATGLPDQWCDRVEYVLAAVCEMRLKAYAVGGNQRLKLLQKDVEQFIGKSSILLCCDVIRELYATVERSEHTNSADNTRLSSLSPTAENELTEYRIRARNFNIIGDHDNARKILEHLIQRRDLGHLEFDVRLSLALTYVFLGDGYEEKDENRMKYFTKAENIMLDLMLWEEFRSNAYGRSSICAKLASIYFYQKSLSKMASVLRQWFVAYSNDDISIVNKQLLLLRVFDAIKEFEPWEIREYFIKVISDDNDLLSQMMLQLALACADISEGNLDSARQNIRDIFEKCEGNAKTFDQDLLDRFLTRIIEIQGENLWLVDSFLTMELVSGLRGSQITDVEQTGVFRSFTTPLQRLLLFIFVSQTEKEDEVKLRYALKAVAMCKEIEKLEERDEKLLEEYNKQYPRVICQLFAVTDFTNLVQLCQCFIEVPQSICNRKEVQRSATTWVRNFIHHCVEQVQSGKLFLVYNSFMTVSNVFSNQLMHPSCVIEMNDLLKAILLRPEMLKFFPVWQSWLQPVEDEKSCKVTRIINHAIRALAKYDTINSSKLLWKLLHCNKLDIHLNLKIKATSLLAFIGEIGQNAVWMLQLAHHWQQAIIQHSAKSKHHNSKFYNDVLMSQNIDEQAKSFWRLLVAEKNNSFIHDKSTLFLFCILDKKLHDAKSEEHSVQGVEMLHVNNPV